MPDSVASDVEVISSTTASLIGGAKGPPQLATVVAQYSNVAALIMVGWVLYQTIGVELPAMREQTFVRTQEIITTMEKMRDSMDNNVKMLEDAKEFQREMMRLHTEQTKVLMELTREIREMRKPAGAGD